MLHFQITTALALFTIALLLIRFPPLIVPIGIYAPFAMQDFPYFLLASLILIAFFCLYQGVINTFRAHSGRQFRYELSIPYVK